MKIMEQIIAKLLGVVVAIIIVSSGTQLMAQRAFSVSEEGKMVEIKPGNIVKSYAVWPQKTQTIIPDPLKIYIHSDNPIDISELKLYVMGRQERRDKRDFLAKLVNLKKNATFNKVEDNLYLLTINPASLSTVGQSFSFGQANISSALNVEYNPNGANKKKGATKKVWLFKRSEQEYDPEEIAWSDDVAVQSINELLSTKQSSTQFFASLIPQSVPNIVGQQGVQYVVVNQQPTQVINESKDEKEKEIVSDIDVDLPISKYKQDNVFALIIANEDYSKVSAVPFAKRDGRMFKDYLNKTLGIEKSHITLVENATLNDMKYELGRLQKISDAYNGEISFIVYYSGHGIPDEKSGSSYLLPVDGYGTDVTTAYSTNALYEMLGNLNSRLTTLVMDACFSGASREGGMLVSARGIAIKAKNSVPKGNLVVLSACQGDETAYPYKEKGHGLMSYYMLKKLKESAGEVSLGELTDYVIDNVSKTAIVANGKSQTPSVSVAEPLADGWRDIMIGK